MHIQLLESFFIIIYKSSALDIHIQFRKSFLKVEIENPMIKVYKQSAVCYGFTLAIMGGQIMTKVKQERGF